MIALPRVDYSDRFAVPFSGVANPERWARVMFGDVPSPGEVFIWHTVLRLRLHRAKSPSTVAGWRIDARGDDWIRLATGSWFLSANLVVRVADGSVALATFLRYDRWPGAVVWPPLSAVHRFLVPRVLRKAAARLAS